MRKTRRFFRQILRTASVAPLAPAPTSLAALRRLIRYNHAMPIRPENRKRYPADWKAISLRVRNDADWRCEWCGAANGLPNPATGAVVVLTVAHLNHQPEDNHRDNLAALCQRCHNRHDAPHRAANRAENAARRQREAGIAAGQLPLFEADDTERGDLDSASQRPETKNAASL